jgi:phosphate transport system substrate-binding protein
MARTPLRSGSSTHSWRVDIVAIGLARVATWTRLLVVLALAAGTITILGGRTAGAATAPPVRVNGQGSTYAALAFQQWISSTVSSGLNVNYTATNSSAGLQSYANNTADFAGSEEEFSSLGQTTVPRGYAYAPDVAGGTAVMYQVQDAMGRAVSDLRLSRLTVAKIFTGMITNWDDPAIGADNPGHVLPNHPITLVGRSGQSGTTALFYDFVQHTDPADYNSWAALNGFQTTSRLDEIDTGTGTNGWVFYSGSDQQAQSISSPGGLWSIGYDEFGYAKVYGDHVAQIQNQFGNWVAPDAANITAALQSVTLNPDTSENLDNVYTSTNPLAYPISSYSYFVYQCAPNPNVPTCTTPYADPAITNMLAQFMRYIACAGQIEMPDIGYASLPPQLSQLMANAVGYMTGQPPEQLTAQNCANPQFQQGLPPPVNGNLSAPVVGMASLPDGTGYWLTNAAGAISAHGNAGDYGSMAGNHLTAPISGISSTADGRGYWLVAADGGVFAFGDAAYFGSMGGRHLNAPVVGVARTQDGQGYWLVASDGGIFAFGDAAFFGSMGGLPLNKPVVGLSADYGTGGYWEVAADGGVFSFGAPFLGSVANLALNRPVDGMASTPHSDGYWIVADDGGIFTCGGAQFHGSTGGMPLNGPVVGMAANAPTGGYWLVASDGGIFTFGTPFLGAD